jgi:two-component system torCAD operon response regulator TorR
MAAAVASPSMQLTTIAVVEDEERIAGAVAARLRAEGFRVEIAGSGPDGVELCRRIAPDLVVLDWMLPGFDGIEACRRIQADRPVPVLFLTARDAEADVLVGLGIGADDYVCKPFNRRELLARVKNLLRRTAAMRQLARRIVSFAGFTFDTASRHVVAPDGRTIQLTRAEYELLRSFVLNPGIVMARDRLLATITHRHDGTNTRTVDVMVKRLRAKLGDDPKAPRIFGTSHGEGYVFTAPLG